MKKGNAESMYKCAKLLTKNHLGDPFLYFKMAASKGYKDAVCKFAKICKYDSYLLQLYKDELIHDFKLAIENGNKEAMYD